MLPSLINLSSSGDLKESLRTSFGVDDTFKLMFLGGGPDVDSTRRNRYKSCKVKVAGNHKGVDIKGDWKDLSFWQQIYQENPTAIVIDSGSDSWMSDVARVNLANYINTTHSILIFSPTKDDFSSPLMTDHPKRYNLSSYGDSQIHFVLTLWSKLPQREYYASEIFTMFPCWKWPSVDERKDCYGAQKVLGNPFDNFDDAVADQISLFSVCGNGA